MALPREERTRLRWGMAGALALHAALLTWVIADRDASVVVETAAPAEPIEVSLVEAPAEQASPEQALAEQASPEQATVVAEPQREPLARVTLPGVPHSEAPTDAPTTERGVPTPSEAHEEHAETYQVDPRASAPRKVDLGIGDGAWDRWAPSTEIGPPPAEPARPAPQPVSRTGGLVEALEAHDRQVGLGPAGTVLTAAREAAHADFAPQLGTATFAITVSSTGQVEVHLASANTSFENWQKVGAAMQTALEHKPPSIPSKRKGVEMKLEVVAEEHWPNGAKVRDQGTNIDVKLPEVKGVDESKEDLASRNPLAVDPVPQPGPERPPLKLNTSLPGVFLEHRGKVCNYALGVTPFGLTLQGGCDPSNIGVKPIRVVSTRIVAERAF